MKVPAETPEVFKRVIMTTTFLPAYEECHRMKDEVKEQKEGEKGNR